MGVIFGLAVWAAFMTWAYILDDLHLMAGVGFVGLIVFLAMEGLGALAW